MGLYWYCLGVAVFFVVAWEWIKKDEENFAGGVDTLSDRL